MVFAIGAIAAALAWYGFALVGLDEHMRALANDPQVRTAFQDPDSGRSDAVVTLVSFAVLTPVAAGFLALMIIFVIKGFEPVLATVRLPVWLSAPLVLSAVIFGAYTTMELWWSDSLYALGLVSRAYLVCQGSAPTLH